MFLADMATKTQAKNLPKTPTHIKTTKTDTWIRCDSNVEIYARSTNQEIVVEVAP